MHLRASLIVIALLSAACDDAVPAAGTTVAKGNAIRGSARTADGRPIDRFTVSFDGWPEGALGGMDGSGRITSPASGHVEGKAGRYEIKLPPGQYTTEAEALVTWHDRPYKFALETVDASDDRARAGVSADAGLARDYVWKLTGVRRGRDAAYVGSGWERNFHGTSIAMDLYQSDTENYQPTQPDLRLTNPDDAVELTLVPKGTLIDGSEGKTISEKIPIAKAGQYGCGVRGIPVGDYVVTARLVGAGGTVEPLRVSLKPAESVGTDYATKRVPWAASADLVFEPEDTGVMAYYGAKGATLYVGK